MDVSPNELRKQTVATFQEADGMLKGANDRMDPALKASLLQTKSQCLNTLTLLREQAQPVRRR